MFTATLPRRFWALSFDWFLLLIFLSPFLSRVWINLFASGEAFLELSWIAIGVIFEIAFKVTFLKFCGGTPGKLIFGLRVVDEQNPEKPLDWGQSILRVWLDHFTLFFSFAFYFTALFRMDRRHVIDLIAHTRVVQKKPLQRVPIRRPVLAWIFIFISIADGVKSVDRVSRFFEVDDGAVFVVDFWTPFIEQVLEKRWQKMIPLPWKPEPEEPDDD